MKGIIYNDRSFVFSKCTFTSNSKKDITNNTSFQLLYIQQGIVNFVSKKNNITANRDQLLYIPADEYGTLTFTGSNEIKILKYEFKYFPINNNTIYPAQVLNMTKTTFDAFNEIPFEETISSITVWKFYDFLDKLQIQLKTIPEKHIKKIESALEYMHTHDTYDVPTLAKICNMSESGFYRTFKAILGTTPIEEKHKIQVQKASDLLETTNLSIDEIASRVGFLSTQHFRKIFKETYGITPTEARKDL